MKAFIFLSWWIWSLFVLIRGEFEKTKPIAGLWPEIRNTKPEIRNGLNEASKTDSSAFYRVRFEKTNPICERAE
jgi:hypothetical protein